MLHIQNMSPSEINQILQVINIRPDATKNDDASKAVFVLLQLVECLNQVEYKREKFYSPSENKTYLGKMLELKENSVLA